MQRFITLNKFNNCFTRSSRFFFFFMKMFILQTLQKPPLESAEWKGTLLTSASYCRFILLNWFTKQYLCIHLFSLGSGLHKIIFNNCVLHWKQIFKINCPLNLPAVCRFRVHIWVDLSLISIISCRYTQQVLYPTPHNGIKVGRRKWIAALKSNICH
jgi:hypothetical protein